MKQTTMNRLLALLRAMPSTQGWNEFTQEMFTAVMAQWEDAFAETVVRAAYQTEEWRPSPARLGSIAANTASPFPDEAATYAEILYKAQEIGLYGTPHPTRPNVLLPGPPPMSHPVVSLVVAYLGGWGAICSGEANLQEGLRKQVRSAWESVSGQWIGQVRQQLLLPVVLRDARFFPCWQPFALPAGYVPGVEYGLPRLPSGEGDDYLPEGAERIGRKMEDEDGG